MLKGLGTLSDTIFWGIRAKMLTSTLDVEELLSKDGASDAFVGINQIVGNVWSSSVHLAQKIGAYCVAFAVLGIGIALLVSGGNAGKRAEVKDSLLAKVAVAVCILGFVAIVAIAQKLGGGLSYVTH